MQASTYAKNFALFLTFFSLLIAPLQAAPRLAQGPLPTDVSFCGDAVPLDWPNVEQRWRQVLHSHSQRPADLYALRQRAVVCLPVVDSILAAHDVPADFRYLMVAESEARPRVVSKAGATGYWQFMRATAQGLGLRVSRHQDDRTDLERSTVAACRHLQWLYRSLGSWTLAAAAFNAGEGHVSRLLAKQDEQDYYRLRWNEETGLYLYRILYFKEMFTRPLAYEPLLPNKALVSLTRPVPGWPEVPELLSGQTNRYGTDNEVRWMWSLSFKNVPHARQAGLFSLTAILFILAVVSFVRELAGAVLTRLGTMGGTGRGFYS